MQLPAERLSPGAPAAGEGPLHFTALPNLQMVFVGSGALRIETEGQRAVVPRGHMACVPAGAPVRFEAAVPTEAYRLQLDAQQAVGVQPFVGAHPEVHAARPVMLELVADAAGWSDTPPAPEVVRAWLTTVSGLAPRWCSPALPLTLSMGQSDELRTALRHLVTRLDRPVGLPDAARAASVSPRTIQRRCTTELGLPLSGWMTHARILLALEQLSLRRLSVGVIAASVGYQSAAAFTRAFSQLLGSTPSAWRPPR